MFLWFALLVTEFVVIPRLAAQYNIVVIVQLSHGTLYVAHCNATRVCIWEASCWAHLTRILYITLSYYVHVYIVEPNWFTVFKPRVAIFNTFNIKRFWFIILVGGKTIFGGIMKVPNFNIQYSLIAAVCSPNLLSIAESVDPESLTKTQTR